METSNSHVGAITRSNQHHIKLSAGLPTELILLILIRLDCRTILAATSTCRRWHALAQEYSQSLWKHLAWRDFSFTAARGYWKLEFLKDRSLSTTDNRRTKLHHIRKSSVENKCASISAEKRVSTAAGPCDVSIEQDGGCGCSSGSLQRQKGKQRDLDWHSNNTDIESRNRDSQRQECQDDEHGQMQDLLQEPDWKALYQLTSNWYRGRARGYCPLMLPSLATLASATEALSLNAAGSVSSKSIPSTYAQRNIHKILAKRKPVAVVGLQHEGSALTDASLISHPDRRSNSKTSRNDQEWCRRTTLLRSNPHYREKRSLTLVATATAASASVAPRRKQRPNIMTQDPLEHDQIAFAISTAPSSRQVNDSSQGISDGVLSGSHQQQQQLSQSTSSASPQFSPPSELEINDHHPVDDILCHYSSAKDSLLLTGHMDGSVRLWDLSIEEPGQQCIRLWRTGSRRRVLSVGMNSKVVVCGSADSTLCVWDIHPPLHTTSPSASASSSSSSSYGTIHAGSYLATSIAVLAPGQDDWISGIEHICVGESLVSCSTDFSGSVLVFSLATGSLVYEIPGLHQPSKMCMTEFFLLTGGRGGRYRSNMQGQQNQPLGLGLNRGVAETDEESTCCINVWDLRTGNLLYSLIPQLPIHQLQHVQDFATILGNPMQPQQSMPRSQRMQESNHVNTFDTTDILCDLSLSSNLSSSGTSRGNSSNQPYKPLSQGSPQSPMSAPLTLLDIAVTDDHSTLLVTLCERSGKGREGVYCWDFTGSGLEGYHHDSIAMPTVALDQNDLEYKREQDVGQGRDSSRDAAYNSAETAHVHDNILSSDELSNNMVMQQVDAIAFKNLHQARITGKLWIAWQQDEEVNQECGVHGTQPWNT